MNETMMNNDNDNNTAWFNAIIYFFIGLFLLTTLVICFCMFAYLKWFKGKKLFKHKYINY